MSEKVEINVKGADKVSINDKNADKTPISDASADKLADIIIFLGNNPNSNSNSIAKLLGVGETSSKKYLRRLIALGFVITHGANKNRTYSLTQDILKLVRRDEQSQDY